MHDYKQKAHRLQKEIEGINRARRALTRQIEKVHNDIVELKAEMKK